MARFATDRDRPAFLLEAGAALDLNYEALEARERDISEERPLSRRTNYITHYIGSKQRRFNWIWKHAPEGV